MSLYFSPMNPRREAVAYDLSAYAPVLADAPLSAYFALLQGVWQAEATGGLSSDRQLATEVALLLTQARCTGESCLWLTATVIDLREAICRDVNRERRHLSSTAKAVSQVLGYLLRRHSAQFDREDYRACRRTLLTAGLSLLVETDLNTQEPA